MHHTLVALRYSTNLESWTCRILYFGRGRRKTTCDVTTTCAEMSQSIVPLFRQLLLAHALSARAAARNVFALTKQTAVSRWFSPVLTRVASFYRLQLTALQIDSVPTSVSSPLSLVSLSFSLLQFLACFLDPDPVLSLGSQWTVCSKSQHPRLYVVTVVNPSTPGSSSSTAKAANRESGGRRDRHRTAWERLRVKAGLVCASV